MEKYGKPAIALHWLIALLIIAAFGVSAWQARQKANAAPSFTTETVRRGKRRVNRGRPRPEFTRFLL